MISILFSTVEADYLKRTGEAKPRKEKSGQVAALLSGIFPGFGQLYNENWAKGFAFFLGSILLDAYILPEGKGYWDIITGQVPLSIDLYTRLLTLILYRIWTIIDADRSVKSKNAETAKALSKNR